MKHFANCTPDEFMPQAMKFRRPFVAWLENIGVQEIRARRPKGFEKLSDKEKADALSRLATENTGEIIAAAFEKDMAATTEIMCLATFTDPKDFNKHTMVEYLRAIMEMLKSEEVRGFFMFYLAPMLRTSFME